MLVYINTHYNRFINDVQIAFFCAVMMNHTVIIISQTAWLMGNASASSFHWVMVLLALNSEKIRLEP